MDRSFWLSLLALGLGIALLLTFRAALDGADYLHGASLAAEIEALQGAPSSEDLATRTTEAAGCLYGNQPRVRTCWYAWVHPERPEYLEVIADRVMADSGGSALGYLFSALPMWLLVLFAGWKATRRPAVFVPSLMSPPPRPEPPRPHERMVP
jgi:hypothetical protein